MSAARVILRRQWADEQPTRAAKIHAPWHDWLIAGKRRYPGFQARKRFARAAMGLESTSADMHHLHGAAI